MRTHLLIVFLALITSLASAAQSCAQSGQVLHAGAACGHPARLRILRPARPASSPRLPAHCRVDGVIDERTGRDGKPYGIGFAVALPANWNGRFLFQGGGGLNGSVQPPLGGAVRRRQLGAGARLCRGEHRLRTPGRGVRRQLLAGPAGRAEFSLPGGGQVTVVAKADRRAALRQARRITPTSSAAPPAAARP